MRKFLRCLLLLLAAALCCLLRGMTALVSPGRPAAPAARIPCSAARQETFSENPYELLGLPQSATLEMVRPAFKKLAGSLHPDVPGSGDESAFRKVLWAYQELTDPARRARWSELRRPAPSRSHFYGFGQDLDEDLEELLDEEDLEDDFDRETDFGRGTRWRRGATNVVEDDEELDGLDEWEELLKQSEKRQAQADAKAWEADIARVKSWMQGQYSVKGSNHGKVVFAKEIDVDRKALIYFWDDRDGDAVSGWWAGPEIGGETVWAFNDNKASTVPPSSGWRIPSSGAVDKTLELAFHSLDSFSVSFNQAVQEDDAQ